MADICNRAAPEPASCGHMSYSFLETSVPGAVLGKTDNSCLAVPNDVLGSTSHGISKLVEINI